MSRSEQQRRSHWMKRTEIVGGSVIGGNHGYNRYEFWERRKIGNKLIPVKIAQSEFTSDESAQCWFKKNYPEEYERGVEMRCYDQWRTAAHD